MALVDLWTLNNTKVGDVNGLTLTSSLDTYDTGKINNGWSQPGIAQSVLTFVGSEASTTGPIGFSLWYKRLDTTIENLRYIWGYGQGIERLVDFTVGRNFLDNFTISSRAQGYSLAITDIPHDLDWHHIVGGWDLANGIIRIWWDNTKYESTGNTPYTYTYTPDKITVAGTPTNTSPAKGTYDIVHVFTHMPTDNEVSYLWNDGNGIEAYDYVDTTSIYDIDGSGDVYNNDNEVIDLTDFNDRLMDRISHSRAYSGDS